MNERIGQIVKQTRKARGITLQTLANATGLSISYLSMLERGQSSPTITSLQKVCTALDITFNDLLLNLDNNKLLVKKDERRVIFEDDHSVLYEAITEGNRNIKSICMTVYDQEEHVSNRHIADELGYIVSGELLMTVNGIVHKLACGDALYICANSQHSFRKISEEPCVSVWSYNNAAAKNADSYPLANLPLNDL